MIVPDAPRSAADVAAHYDELDTAYRRIWGDHIHHGYWHTGRESAAEAAEALVRLVEARLSLEPGQAVCDIGCGYGATAVELAARNEVSVLGLTVSAVQEQIARSRADPGFACLRRDWLDNQLPDGSFDRAYAIESSEHMVDKGLFFTEASRVLRPGGRLVVCAWLEGEGVRRWETRHLLKPICTEGRLPSMGSRADYQELASAAGLALESYEDVSQNVRKTWGICLRRLVAHLMTDRAVRRLVLSSATENRNFALSLPRLIVALRTGAMRYGIFVWEKPCGSADAPLSYLVRCHLVDARRGYPVLEREDEGVAHVQVSSTEEPDFVAGLGQVDYTHIRYAPVLTAVVVARGRTLLLQRSSGMRSYPNCWCGVSGYLDDDRSVEEKARQELQEEAGITGDRILSMERGRVLLQEAPDCGKSWLVVPVLVRVRGTAYRLDWESRAAGWFTLSGAMALHLLPGFDEVIKQYVDVLSA